MTDPLIETDATDKLYEHHRQQLSAMLDGALSPDAARFMLRRLQHDTELAACWERWRVCGDAMRGQRHALLPVDFAQRIGRAIAAERSVPSAVMPGRPRWARWGGGAALAASVAVATLFVARQGPGPLDPAGGETPTQIVAASPPSPASGMPDPQTSNPAAPAAASQLVAATLATAEVPRRTAERRSRGQSQRAALRAPSRSGGAAIVATASAPTLAPALANAGPDPFAAQPLAPSGRPWPHAVLPSYPAAGGFSVDYGNTGPPSSFHPFDPRGLRASEGAAADVAEPAPDPAPARP